MDLMVKISMAIEREVDDAQNISEAGVKVKRKVWDMLGLG